MMSQNQTESHSSQKAAASVAAYDVDLVSHGVRFRLVAETREMLELMRQVAPFRSRECTREGSGVRTFALRGAGAPTRYEAIADEEQLACEERLEPALMELGGQMMLHVAEQAPEYVFIHAGAVALGNRALLLPGRSHAGKSTLVAELVRAGAAYYSDEFALIDAEGRLHPFARDLRMRRPGLPEQTPVPASQLNGRVGSEALRVSLVVFAEFAENAPWAPQAMTPGRAVLELLLHTIAARRTPGRVLAALSKMTCHATAWRSRRGEAAPVARALLAALATGEAPA
jgi:hypothetical protein